MNDALDELCTTLLEQQQAMAYRRAYFVTARAKLGLTQAELAKELGVHVRSIIRYESGDRPLPGPVAKAIAAMVRDVA